MQIDLESLSLTIHMYQTFAYSTNLNLSFCFIQVAVLERCIQPYVQISHGFIIKPCKRQTRKLFRQKTYMRKNFSYRINPITLKNLNRFESFSDTNLKVHFVCSRVMRRSMAFNISTINTQIPSFKPNGFILDFFLTRIWV